MNKYKEYWQFQDDDYILLKKPIPVKFNLDGKPSSITITHIVKSEFYKDVDELKNSHRRISNDFITKLHTKTSDGLFRNMFIIINKNDNNKIAVIDQLLDKPEVTEDDYHLIEFSHIDLNLNLNINLKRTEVLPIIRQKIPLPIDISGYITDEVIKLITVKDIDINICSYQLKSHSVTIDCIYTHSTCGGFDLRVNYEKSLQLDMLIEELKSINFEKIITDIIINIVENDTDGRYSYYKEKYYR